MSFVISQIALDELNKITAQANELNRMIQPKAVKVEDDKKAGVRTMAEGREGIVRLISKIALQHEDCLSRKDNAKDLADKLAYDSNLESARQALFELLEQIESTQWANSADIMEMSDRFAGALQSQRKNNTALNHSMHEVDNWNKRFSGGGSHPAVSVNETKPE